MDNLYNSGEFCRESYKHDKMVIFYGLARKGMRGIPAVVKQEEFKNRKKKIQVIGTVRAEVLQGDKECPKIVASSIYDAKPIKVGGEDKESLQCRHWTDQDNEVFTHEKHRPLQLLNDTC